MKYLHPAVCAVTVSCRVPTSSSLSGPPSPGGLQPSLTPSPTSAPALHCPAAPAQGWGRSRPCWGELQGSSCGGLLGNPKEPLRLGKTFWEPGGPPRLGGQGCPITGGGAGLHRALCTAHPPWLQGCGQGGGQHGYRLHQPGPSLCHRMVLGRGPRAVQQECPCPHLCAGRQRCPAASARRHNSLPSGRSALPRSDKVPRPQRGWAPVWVWPPPWTPCQGWCLCPESWPPGSSARQGRGCGAALGADVLAGRGGGGLGSEGDTDPACPAEHRTDKRVLGTPATSAGAQTSKRQFEQ